MTAEAQRRRVCGARLFPKDQPQRVRSFQLRWMANQGSPPRTRSPTFCNGALGNELREPHPHPASIESCLILSNRSSRPFVAQRLEPGSRRRYARRCDGDSICPRHASRAASTMISVVEQQPAGSSTDLVQQVEHIFSPTGVLSRAKNFEYRPEQQQMAVAA